jgi:hypothetical protein
VLPAVLVLPANEVVPPLEEPELPPPVPPNAELLPPEDWPAALVPPAAIDPATPERPAEVAPEPPLATAPPNPISPEDPAVPFGGMPSSFAVAQAIAAKPRDAKANQVRTGRRTDGKPRNLAIPVKFTSLATGPIRHFCSNSWTI